MISALRQATPDDAENAARIVILTGEGVVERLLDGLVPGVDSLTILTAAFISGEGVYRTENMLCGWQEDSLVSLLFSYPSWEHRVPQLMESMVPAKRLRAVRPILERSVPDSLYINTLWLADNLRGNGRADALFAAAARRGLALGLKRISLFCWNDNKRAMRFYARNGCSIAELLPPDMLPLEGHPQGGAIWCRELRG
jgi:ribosomal protein S18 acetylase RimI-like enzyme